MVLFTEECNTDFWIFDETLLIFLKFVLNLKKKYIYINVNYLCTSIYLKLDIVAWWVDNRRTGFIERTPARKNGSDIQQIVSYSLLVIEYNLEIIQGLSQ